MPDQTTARPAGLDALLGHVAANLPDEASDIAGPLTELRVKARQWARTDDPDQPLRWRAVYTDSENQDGVALVCTAAGVDDQHVVLEDTGERDQESVYQCCHWMVMECHSEDLAAYIAAVLNADADQP